MLKLLLVLLIVLNSVSALQINEILANPEDDEDFNEWIELYNNESYAIDLEGYTIEDDTGLDLILGGKYNGKGTIIPQNSYAILTSETTRVYDNFDVPTVIKLYVNETRIGKSGLSNSGETLKLYDRNSNLLDKITYPSTSNGNSYSSSNSTWQETTPTPGKNNHLGTSSINYSSVSITEFLPNPEGDDSDILPNGEWIELFNSGSISLDLLGLEFYDNSGTDSDVIISNTTTLSGTTIDPNSYLIIYTNGISGFLNNEGLEVIKLYDVYNNLIDEISYSNSNEGISWSLSDNKWQEAIPTPGYLNEDNSSSTESILKIDEIYDLGTNSRAEWGDIIRPKLYVYKGNTNKNVVWIWIESDEQRITKKSKFNAYNKFQNYTFTYPIMISDNCDNSLTSGNHKIIIEGLDKRLETKIEIRGTPLCTSQKIKVKNFDYELISLPSEIKIGETFYSKIRIVNNEKENIVVDVWSFPYSGNKKFVGEEKENVQIIKLKPQEQKIVSLKNTLTTKTTKDALNFKVRLLRNDRKNPYEIKDSFHIQKTVKNEELPSKTLKNSVTGNVVYESKGQKSHRSSIFVLNGLFVLLLIYVIKWKFK